MSARMMYVGLLCDSQECRRASAYLREEFPCEQPFVDHDSAREKFCQLGLADATQSRACRARRRAPNHVRNHAALFGLYAPSRRPARDVKWCSAVRALTQRHRADRLRHSPPVLRLRRSPLPTTQKTFRRCFPRRSTAKLPSQLALRSFCLPLSRRCAARLVCSCAASWCSTPPRSRRHAVAGGLLAMACRRLRFGGRAPAFCRRPSHCRRERDDPRAHHTSVVVVLLLAASRRAALPDACSRRRAKMPRRRQLPTNRRAEHMG